MLFENDVSKKFLKEAVNPTIYIMNRVQIKKGTNKTPYELWFGHAASVKYFRIFGIKCFIREMVIVTKILHMCKI